MNPITSILFYTGAAFMLLDAVLYSFGALGPIRAALKPADTYWNRRLLLNLLLANMGLYFTAPSPGLVLFLQARRPTLQGWCLSWAWSSASTVR
jgi:hypothetical protein